MNNHSSQTTHRQVELQRVALQASEWLVKLEDNASQDHSELAEWLLESPLHTQMFLRAAAIDRQGAALHPAVLDVLMKQLEAEAGTNNILPMAAQPFKQWNSRHAKAARSKFYWPAGLAAACGLIGFTWWYHVSGPGSWDRYTTAVGEQHSITLRDGSLIHLNTRTCVDVRYSRTARDLRLVQGEALFTVEKDSARPFKVRVDDTVVQALGTQFNVYRRAHESTVAVLEGAVRISTPLAGGGVASPTHQQSLDPAKSGNGSQQLTAGQIATVRDGGQIKTSHSADVAQTTAWRRGQLVFERASLERIAEEFNRYNRKPQLKIDQRLSGEYRYTAVFDVDNPELLLEFLRRDPNLRFSAQDGYLHVEPK